MGNEKKFNPIRPTLGRQLKLIASVLGTVRKFEANRKSDDIEKELGKLATQPFFKWNKLLEIRDHVFRLPFEYPEDRCSVLQLPFDRNREKRKCERFVKKLPERIMEEAARVNDDYPAEILDEQEVRRQYALFVAKELVPFVQDVFGDELGKRVLSDNALKIAFDCLERKYGSWRNSILDKKQKGKIDGWYEGDHVPQMNDLFEMLNPVIDEEDVQSREMLFVAGVVAKSKRWAEKRQVDSLLQECIESVLENADASAFPEERERKIRETKEEFEKAFCDAGTEIKRLSEHGNCSGKWWGPPIEKFAEVCTKLLIKKDAVECRKELLKALALICDKKYEKAHDVFVKIMPYLLYDADMGNVFLFYDERARCYNVALGLGAFLALEAKNSENKRRKPRLFLQRMKNYGIICGMFTPSVKQLEKKGAPEAKTKLAAKERIPAPNKKSRNVNDIVEEWEVNAWRSEFLSLFSEESGPYVNGPLVYDVESMPREPQEPYSRSFNVDGETFPQITWFCRLSDIDAVQRILERSLAPSSHVNALTSSGESALLFAIEHMVPRSSWPFDPKTGMELFKLLSAYKHEKNTIDMLTYKTKLTCLGQAVCSGNAEVVSKLLEMGAEVDRLQSVDQISPLHRTIGIRGRKLNEWREEAHFDLDGLRRIVPLFRGKTNNQIPEAWRGLNENSPFATVFESVINVISAQEREYCLRSKMLEIAKVLLKYGANPNLPQKVNGWEGYTPLMLAAETNQYDLFDLMVTRYNGNPNQKADYEREDGSVRELSCWEIAVEWHADEVLRYLEHNRNRFV